MKTLYLKFTVILVFLLVNTNIFAQVLITDDGGTTSPENSAMLEIKSDSKGVLIPRISTVQRNLLHTNSTAKPGLLVFDNEIGSFFIYGTTSSKANGWIDLSTDAGIWTKNDTCVYLSDPRYNVGIGTQTPNRKFVLKAENDSDTLFEIQDQYGKSLMVITPTLTKFFFNETTTKGTAGGFAVGRYATAKGKANAILDTTLFLVTPDSTRVYTTGSAVTATAGGFAVGRYATAKGSKALKAIKYFETNANRTRVYTDGESVKGTAGGFAVGRYATAKGNNEEKYFFTDIDSTRIYTDGSGKKGTAGGFAVGRYATAKAGGTDNYMYMLPDNYFIGHQSGDSLQNSNYTGKYNTFFGYQTGLKDTSGSHNVFIGHQAGYENTDGLYNIFMGNKTGFNNIGHVDIQDTTGSRNVYIGYEAGLTDEQGADNISIGFKAGHKTEGNKNVFLGSNAGSENLLSKNNVYIGTEAGKNNDGLLGYAEDNVYIGLRAGEGPGNTSNSGSDNVFIGKSAGAMNTTGDYNTFVGYLSGTENRGGDYNTYLGYLTGCVSRGDFNTYIGCESGSGTTAGSNYNVFMGYHAGVNHGTGDNNVYIGNEAGSGVSFMLQDEGENNVFIGSNTGTNNTLGASNVFLGTNSGFSNTEGIRNVFLGNYAGYSNIGGTGVLDGDGNVFIGDSAGYLNSDGWKNVFLGTSAGVKNTEGCANVFLGDNAGSHNSDGSFNIYIGSQAGEETTGRSNTFVGTLAGRAMQGNGNTLLGDGAGACIVTNPHDLNNNTLIGIRTVNRMVTGEDNVALGNSAGRMLNTGSKNVFLGAGAGYGSGTYTASSNVMIGYNAGHDETNSNRLYINNETDDTPLIYGEFDRGYLQINDTLNIAGQYNMPSINGTAGQVLLTNGTDAAYWADQSSLNDADWTVSGSNMYSAVSGNVGIGTTTPGYNLDIVEVVNTSAPMLRIYQLNTSGDASATFLTNGGNQFTIGIDASDSDKFKICDNSTLTSNPRLTINSDGNVGIEATTTGQPLNVNGDIETGSGAAGDGSAEWISIRADNDNWYMGVQNETTAGASDFFIGKDYAEDGTFHIQNNGYVGVGTSTPDYPFEVERSNAGSSAGDNKFISMFKNTGGVNSDGIRIQAGGNSASTTGDVIFMYCQDGDGTWLGSVYSHNGSLQIDAKSAKLGEKYEIKETNKGLSLINKLQVVDYDFNSKDNTYKTGFVGEDVMKVFPGMVRYEVAADEYGISNSTLVPVLTKGMQEQQVQIEQLKSEISSLKEQNKKIEILEKQIQELMQLIQHK